MGALPPHRPLQNFDNSSHINIIFFLFYIIIYNNICKFLGLLASTSMTSSIETFYRNGTWSVHIDNKKWIGHRRLISDPKQYMKGRWIIFLPRVLEYKAGADPEIFYRGGAHTLSLRWPYMSLFFAGLSRFWGLRPVVSIISFGINAV